MTTRSKRELSSRFFAWAKLASFKDVPMSAEELEDLGRAVQSLEVRNEALSKSAGLKDSHRVLVLTESEYATLLKTLYEPHHNIILSRIRGKLEEL